MKQLLLMRHAKSSWDNPALTDFARPLNARGLQAAPQIGRYLLAQGIKPSLMISSPATRARQTTQLVCETAWPTLAVRYEATIYEASTATLLSLVWRLPDTSATVVMVGHNPGMAGLLAYLTSQHEHFPTAAVACINLPAENWAGAEGASGQLAWLVRPKELPAMAGARPQ